MHRWVTSNGSLEMWYPTPAIVADAIVGHLDLELARQFAKRLTLRMAQGPVHVFSDWARLNGYDSNARVELTSWALQHRKDFASIHALVGSKLVAIGVSVANVTLGNIMRAYVRRADFDAACAGVLVQGGASVAQAKGMVA